MGECCRTCLRDDCNEFYDVWNELVDGTTFADYIQQLSSIQIGRNDGLPQIICPKCVKDLQSTYEFIKTLRTSERILKNHFESTYKQEKLDDSSNLPELDHPLNKGNELMENDEDLFESNSEFHMNQDGTTITDRDETYTIEAILEGEAEDEISTIHNVEQQPDVLQHNGDLLVELAHVAASQQTLEVATNDSKTTAMDEFDEEYLIEYIDELDSTAEPAAAKPAKWKCAICNRILHGDVSYEGHMNWHRKSKPYKCSQCPTTFRSHSALKRHKNLRHHSLTHNCPLCQKSFRLEKLLEEHMLNHTKNDVECTLCNLEFPDEASLQLHEILEHDFEANTCPLCQIVTDNIQQHLYTKHQAEYDKSDNVSEEIEVVNVTENTSTEQQQQCEECTKQDSSSVNRSHKCNKSDNQNLDQCTICKKYFLRKNLEKHMALHKRKSNDSEEQPKKYLCAYCPRSFKNTKNLNQHERIHKAVSNNIVYTCEQCDRQYATKYLLDNHRKQAHKERDNICPICGNAFKLKNQLMNHMKLHLEKNIPCPHCDKKYARQFDLNVHLRTHTGEMPFACHLCDKRFAIKVRLTYHLQKHYGIKHRCKECSAEFNSKQKLKAHSFKHTGMPYRCGLCNDHGFPTRNVFKRHLSRVHNATMSDEALVEMFQRNTGKTTRIKQITDFNCIVGSDDDRQTLVDVN